MIDDARWRRVEEIFNGALLRTGDDRTAFVTAACGDDEELRQEVETLLAHASAGQPVLTPSIGTLAAQVIGGVPATLQDAWRARTLPLLRPFARRQDRGRGSVHRKGNLRLAHRRPARCRAPLHH